MFENKTVEGIYYSRIVASWYNAGGKRICWHGDFAEWLKLLVINGRHLTEDEIHDLQEFATNGKLELESSVNSYLSAKR